MNSLFSRLLLLQCLVPLALSFPTTVPIVTAVTNSSKAGLAGDWGNESQFTETGKVSWYYTWSPSPADNSKLEFVPMLWGGGDKIDDFASTINQTIIDHNVTAVLGFNEPQQKGQSNLTPQEGADLWKTYLEPLRALGVRLGSPAPSGAPSGKVWLNDFLTACAGGCTVDFIALHWYDVNATAFIHYLEDFHSNFSRPLWVTEWDCQNFNQVNEQCTMDDIVLFLNETQSYMDQSDFVERYAWFGVMTDLQGVNAANGMVDSQGNINSLGKQYIGAEAPKTSGSGNADGPHAPGGSGASGMSVKWNYMFAMLTMSLMTAMMI